MYSPAFDNKTNLILNQSAGALTWSTEWAYGTSTEGINQWVRGQVFKEHLIDHSPLISATYHFSLERNRFANFRCIALISSSPSAPQCIHASSSAYFGYVCVMPTVALETGGRKDGRWWRGPRPPDRVNLLCAVDILTVINLKCHHLVEKASTSTAVMN